MTSAWLSPVTSPAATKTPPVKTAVGQKLSTSAPVGAVEDLDVRQGAGPGAGDDVLDAVRR